MVSPFVAASFSHDPNWFAADSRLFRDGSPLPAWDLFKPVDPILRHARGAIPVFPSLSLSPLRQSPDPSADVAGPLLESVLHELSVFGPPLVLGTVPDKVDVIQEVDPFWR